MSSCVYRMKPKLRINEKETTTKTDKDTERIKRMQAILTGRRSAAEVVNTQVVVLEAGTVDDVDRQFAALLPYTPSITSVMTS